MIVYNLINMMTLLYVNKEPKLGYKRIKIHSFI